MLNCRQTSHLVSRSLDERLNWRERFAMRLHLLICDACTHFKRQMEFLHQAARRYLPPGDSLAENGQLSADARTRIHRALQQAGR